jgi:protein transport protein SEC31
MCAAAVGATTEFKSHAVRLQQLCTEPDLVQRSESLAAVAQGGDLKAFCDSQADSASTEQEQQTWRTMRLLLEGDSARQHLLRELGFEPSQEKGKAAAAPAPVPAAKPAHAEPEISEADFFDNFGSDSAPSAPVCEKVAEAPQSIDSSELDNTPPLSFLLGAGESPLTAAERASTEDAVHRALMVGDFAAAVKGCLRLGRMADALVLASCAGPDQWAQTQSAFLQRHPHAFVRQTVAAIVTQDFDKLVAQTAVDDASAWKQTMAILITYTSGAQYRTLCSALGERLAKAAFTSRKEVFLTITAFSFFRLFLIFVCFVLYSCRVLHSVRMRNCRQPRSPTCALRTPSASCRCGRLAKTRKVPPFSACSRWSRSCLS